jgi:SAM-dependent methyltransferase
MKKAIAHELWIERGKPYNDDWKDWLEAEMELSAEETNIRRTPYNFEIGYPNLLQIASRKIPYLPLFHAWHSNDERNKYRWNEVELLVIPKMHTIPSEFLPNPLPNSFQEQINAGLTTHEFDKCRFEKYKPYPVLRGFNRRITFTISQTNYLDYLRIVDCLDKQTIGVTGNVSNRQKYMPLLPKSDDFSFSPLTNICGVGVFLLTSDNKIIVSQQSKDISVYPSMYTYSASGTMDWNNGRFPIDGNPIDDNSWTHFLHPFAQVTRECKEELDHDIDREHLRLIGFGIDAAKLYFQFSFIEKTNRTSDKIIQNAENHAQDWYEKQQVKAIPFELDTITRLIKRKMWEPSAEATLLNILISEFGLNEVEREIDVKWVYSQMYDDEISEWEKRASRKGVLAVMSDSYPPSLVETESKNYVEKYVDFLKKDAANQDVLEIGVGIGRFSLLLVDLADKLTCLDISKTMIERTKDSLKDKAGKVEFFCDFIQTFQPPRKYKIAISSLLLIHIVDDNCLQEAINSMARCADIIYLAEDIGGRRNRSRHTKIRSVDELQIAFLNEGFRIDKQSKHILFNDEIVFLKLVRDSMFSQPQATIGAFSKNQNSEPLAHPILTKKFRQKPVKIFISYAHEDEKLKDDLLKHLSSLKNSGVIDTWDDRKIMPGQDWNMKINDNIKTADIILLLISASFLSSTYINSVEMSITMERYNRSDAVVIPIILRPVDWEDEPIGQIQAIPKDGRPVTLWENTDSAFLDIVNTIKKTILHN